MYNENHNIANNIVQGNTKFHKCKWQKLTQQTRQKFQIKVQCENCSLIRYEMFHKEKYLGDFVTSSGNFKETICDRKNRGTAILVEIRAIPKDIPLGNQNLKLAYYFGRPGSLMGSL